MKKSEGYKDAEAWLTILDRKDARITELKYAVIRARQAFATILELNLMPHEGYDQDTRKLIAQMDEAIHKNDAIVQPHEVDTSNT